MWNLGCLIPHPCFFWLLGRVHGTLDPRYLPSSRNWKQKTYTIIRLLLHFFLFLLFNPVQPPNNSIDFNGYNYPNLVDIATDGFNDTVAAYNMTFSDQVQCTYFQTRGKFSR